MHSCYDAYNIQAVHEDIHDQPQFTTCQSPRIFFVNLNLEGEPQRGALGTKEAGEKIVAWSPRRLQTRQTLMLTITLSRYR